MLAKKIAHKSAEATGDLIGNKIADKITAKPSKKSQNEEIQSNEVNNEIQKERYIPPKERQKIIDELRLMQQYNKGIPKNSKFHRPNQPSKFRTKNWIEIKDEPRVTYNVNSQIKFKTTMLKSSLCDYRDVYILVKGKITITGRGVDAAARLQDERDVWHLKIVLHLLIA